VEARRRAEQQPHQGARAQSQSQPAEHLRRVRRPEHERRDRSQADKGGGPAARRPRELGRRHQRRGADERQPGRRKGRVADPPEHVSDAGPRVVDDAGQQLAHTDHNTGGERDVPRHLQATDDQRRHEQAHADGPGGDVAGGPDRIEPAEEPLQGINQLALVALDPVASQRR
jgi:hypothetical protein